MCGPGGAVMERGEISPHLPGRPGCGGNAGPSELRGKAEEPLEVQGGSR